MRTSETKSPSCCLAASAVLSPGKRLNPERSCDWATRSPDVPVLVVLAAGKGTRFGMAPKCVQPVAGLPLARHSIDAFRRFAAGCPVDRGAGAPRVPRDACMDAAPVICMVHYRHEDVRAALGDDIAYVLSANPAGGTAFAAYEAFSVPGLAERNPLLILTMGDRIVPESVFRRLCEIHGHDGDGAPRLTLLTACYMPPRHIGKGRMERDAQGRVRRIIEQRDIDALSDPVERRLRHDITEANCPLYAVRATVLQRYLAGLTCDNAQNQFYLTDLVERLVGDGGDVRTLTVTPADAEYELLCSDVTRPQDLAPLEGILRLAVSNQTRDHGEVDSAMRRICCGRPAGQTAAIAAQLHELYVMAACDRLGFRDNLPVSVGVSGGRLRIAFMHPDMGRFYGPAWQMPIGAADAAGREQIVVLVQEADDGAIHLHPADARFREKLDSLPADDACMYPGDEVTDWYSYEGFGTRMAERLLLALGYFSEEELQRRREAGSPLPPPALWVGNGMRRPFSLIVNAIASIRTLRAGAAGAKVQACLGRQGFQGLRLALTGAIPRGGFSSSSAVTVAVKNAVNSLYDLEIPPDLLVHLACQAEYGTGVRAGSLDQATAQKGKAGQGALISSNPRENYRILGVFPAPTERVRVIFPYTVDRDRDAWKWSVGMYGENTGGPLPTAEEIRKLTGKSAEMAAILTHLPLATDFFPCMEADLMRDGYVGHATARRIAAILLELPLRISREALQSQLHACRPWLSEQYRLLRDLTPALADAQADAALISLMTGWREPLLRRPGSQDRGAREIGVPLRAMTAYLFGEVAKNFHLIRHPEAWIDTVRSSQAGDRCFDIDPALLPDADEMLGVLPWEIGLSGPERLAAWIERTGATPVDFNRGLDDASLSRDDRVPLHRLEGGNFFRGLALIDLAEAMLKRAFGPAATAVRVNAAGQGDYFQLHIDTQAVSVDTVQAFFRQAFYHRFGLHPDPPFCHIHPGGPAVGVRLNRFDQLPALIQMLAAQPQGTPA